MKLRTHAGVAYQRPRRPVPQDIYSGLARAAMERCPECSPLWTRLRSMNMGLFLYGSFYYELGLLPLGLIRLVCTEHRQALMATSTSLAGEIELSGDSGCLPCMLKNDTRPDHERFLLGFMVGEACEDADLNITKTLCLPHGQERAKGIVLLGEHLSATIEASI